MVYDETFDAEFYENLVKRKLLLKMKNADGQAGGRKSNAKGNSVEFSDFREYIPGDDTRRIDWNAYGRFDRLFVKLFMEEKEGIFRVFLDNSRSMNFGEPLKSKIAKQWAAVYGYSVLDNGDRAILHVKESGLSTKYSYTGKQGFSKLIDRIAAVDFNDTTDISQLILKADIKQRGVSVVISDFYTENLEAMLKYLAIKKQEIILIQVLGRAEAEPEIYGTVKLLDSESDSFMRVSSSNRLSRDYGRQYNNFISNIEVLSRKYGARYVRLVDGIQEN